MIRIAWRGLAGWADLAETMTDISSFADSCIVHSLSFLYDFQSSVYGFPASKDGSSQHLVVIGMGKLGARELNFSSDIDLIFAYPEVGETTGKGEKTSNHEFFNGLCRRLIKTIGEATADGMVFRVDLRLRPYGENGPLVVSFDAMEDYYQSQGREWERYAWIKARVIADNGGEGKKLLQMLKPFVYRRYLDYGVFESLRDMKRMISAEEKRKGFKNNIKLGSGGIREIEFFAQVFQLIRGGVAPVLQERRLQVALQRLFQEKCISSEICETLLSAYEFLRNTEHRLQEFSDQQTHNLPSDAIGLERLAASMGFESDKDFSFCLKQHMETVHLHFNSILEDETSSETKTYDQEQLLRLEHIWHSSIKDDESKRVLSDIGYENPEEVLYLLTCLKNDPATYSLGKKGRERLDRLMPVVLRETGRSKQPVFAIKKIIDLIKTIERRTCYISLLLENPMVLKQLIELATASPWILSFLSLHPVLLDQLIDPRMLYSCAEKDELQIELENRLKTLDPDDLELQIQELCIFKQINILRVAASDISGATPLMRVSDHLTNIAESVLRKVFDLSWQYLVKKHGLPYCHHHGSSLDKGFVAIAYGKLGGIELGYGSDLDLVFLHAGANGQTTGGEKPIDNNQFFARLGQRVIHMLTARTPAGLLYNVDMRLRPSGS
jgi:glutamate-ammonia-ligase adenylyltransferase